MKLRSHIMLDGQAEEALHFYKEIFNGEIIKIVRNGDVPNDIVQPQIEAAYKHRIMYSSIAFENNVLEFCDKQPNDTLLCGNNISLDLVFDDDKDIHRVYKALADGGEIITPLASMYYSPNFGILTDRYGICWILMQIAAK